MNARQTLRLNRVLYGVKRKLTNALTNSKWAA